MQYPNLVTLIAAFAPDELRALRGRHAEKTIFSSGRELGEPAPAAIPDSATQDNVARAALVDLLKASCARLHAPLAKLASDIKMRMHSVTRLKFFGALVASLAGGVGAVTSYLALGDQATTLVSALLGMAGGAAGLMSDYFEKAPSGVRIAGTEEYARLVAMIGAVELMQIQVDRDSVKRLSSDELDGMLKTLDEYALAVVRLIHA